MNPVPRFRDDPRHYTVPDLPSEFVTFESPVDGIGVGRPGKVGLLEITFAPRCGVTRITNQFQQFPLQVFRPIYLDPHQPETAFVYVMSHGGALQGDRSRLDITCEPGASAHVTTQSAAKIYRMERNYATQIVQLTADRESFLEYLPDPVIPFRDSRFCGRNLITVDPTASVIVGEVLLPGRVAYGEQHDYTAFCSRTEACGTDGALLFSDSLEFIPHRDPVHSPGRLGRHAALATLYVISRRISARSLSDRLHERLMQLPDVACGASELPNDCGAWARILGEDSISVSAALHTAWDEARLALTGAPAPNRRKT